MEAGEEVFIAATSAETNKANRQLGWPWQELVRVFGRDRMARTCDAAFPADGRRVAAVLRFGSERLLDTIPSADALGRQGQRIEQLWNRLGWLRAKSVLGLVNNGALALESKVTDVVAPTLQGRIAYVNAVAASLARSNLEHLAYDPDTEIRLPSTSRRFIHARGSLGQLVVAPIALAGEGLVRAGADDEDRLSAEDFARLTLPLDRAVPRLHLARFAPRDMRRAVQSAMGELDALAGPTLDVLDMH